jgi:hypothetical protein
MDVINLFNDAIRVVRIVINCRNRDANGGKLTQYGCIYCGDNALIKISPGDVGLVGNDNKIESCFNKKEKSL